MTAGSDGLGAIFDWDGVVVASAGLHERAWQMLADRVGLPLPDSFFSATFGMQNRQIIREFTSWAEPHETERIDALARDKERLYRELVEREGVATTPGTVELLGALARERIPCAIGSSAPRRNIDAVLEALDLTRFFAAITTAEDVARGKPDPEVFLRCADALDRDPARCVVLEDSPAGLRAARAGGMRCIAVATTHPADALAAVGADLVVDALIEVDIGAMRTLFR